MKVPKLYALAAVVAGIVYALDQYTKRFMFENPPLVGFSVIPHVLSWITHRNYGITFNVPVPLIIILFLTGAISIGLIWLLVRAVKKGRLDQTIALGCALGGAWGNFSDRLSLGYVRDWILLFSRSAINVADIAIALGLIWFFYTLKQDEKVTDAASTPRQTS